MAGSVWDVDFRDLGMGLDWSLIAKRGEIFVTRIWRGGWRGTYSYLKICSGLCDAPKNVAIPS